MKLLRITAPHFIAGIEPGGLRAPILHYMRTWSATSIRGYCKRRGWAVEEIEFW